MLTFDPVEHKYYWKGVHVPNVTSVIHDLTDMSMIPPGTLEIARAKGQAIHKMVELWACGDLRERADQPEWIQPAYDQLMRVIDETGLKVIASEKRVYHPVWAYAGTLDLRCIIRNKGGEGLIDVKRTFLSGPAIGVQLAAYEAAENADKSQEPLRWRAALRLSENAPYRLEMYQAKDDWDVYLACLIRHRWMMKHGLL